MQRYRDYDPFAWLYAHHWGREFHRAAWPMLERALLNQLPAGAQILDLCCGDGRVSQRLEKRGFRVTGIDGSEEMLRYAHERAPTSRFLLADARDFDLPPRFAAVVCTFDSLNHVMQTPELGAVFANVYRALRRGGVFLFDLNREEAYTDLWATETSTVKPTVVSVASGDYSAPKRLATCDITVLRKHGSTWERTDFQMRQRYHRAGEVMELLTAAGFAAEVHDAAALGMTGPMGTGRNVFLARKPKR